MIGMVAANEQPATSFVSLAGAGRPLDEVLLEQLTVQLPGNLLVESRDILVQLKEGNLVAQVSPELASIFRPSVQPYLISWLAYDPQKELAKLDMPILVIGGTTDLQVPLEDAELLKAAHEKAELLIIENMNHVLKTATAVPEENMATYSNPDLPLADGLIDGMVEFLLKK
ncbi:Hydrolase, alpha/beta fold family [Planococcus halocryophilus Or1]|nr:Hydrolase, alpha/beta fold family [Planococcus halocryophilus Or1]